MGYTVTAVLEMQTSKGDRIWVPSDEALSLQIPIDQNQALDFDCANFGPRLNAADIILGLATLTPLKVPVEPLPQPPDLEDVQRGAGRRQAGS